MGVPDFDRWEDAAPLIAQVEHLHSRMCTLSLDLAEVESAGNPVVINTLLSRIAGTGLTQADIIRDLAVRLHTHVIDPEHITEVLTALDVARKPSRTLAVQPKARQKLCGVTRSYRPPGSG